MAFTKERLNIDENTLEYCGPYEGNRVTCNDCSKYKEGRCELLESTVSRYYGVEVEVSGSNNVCKQFKKRITHPNHRQFYYDEYFEWLMNDYYRPYGIDKNNIIGSAKLGEVIIDGGKMYRLLPNIYSPFYKTQDKPYCSLRVPNAHIKINGDNFSLNYRLFRDLSFINTNDEISYITHTFKKSRKRNESTHNGKININEIRRRQ